MTSRTVVVENLRTVYASFGSLVRSLSPAQWQAPSLCPAWTTEGVVAHVTTVEIALLGWRPGGVNPFEAMAAIATELAGLGPPALRDRYLTVTDERLAELDAMTDDDFDAPSITPVGPGTYGRFMAIREFDIWVHERDIRVPLGLPGDDGGPAAEMALDEVEGSIGYIVGKKIGLPDGTGLAIELTGPVHRRILTRVDGRAARVDELPSPDVTLSLDSLTFMLLACGRIDPNDPIDDGRVTLSGDPDLATRAAHNLAFTM